MTNFSDALSDNKTIPENKQSSKVSMSRYNRVYLPGGHYFFTLVTHRRKAIFLETSNVDRLRQSLHHVKQKHPFSIDAIVILPDHLHLIVRLPPGDADFSTRLRLIKHHFAIGMPSPINKRGEKLIWQRRFWEHTIRDERDWLAHVDYIHYNPVKHGYVKRPTDWRHSSIHNAIQKGWYSKNWGNIPPGSIKGMNPE